MGCSLNNRIEKIDKYLRGELTEKEMEAFEIHFLECDECFEELQTTKHLMDYMQAEETEVINGLNKVKNAKQFSFIEKYSKILDSLILPHPVLGYGLAVVLCGLIIFRIFIYDNETSQTVNLSDQIVQQEGLQRFAQNFIESPDLEKFINQNYRSASGVVIKSPAKDEITNNKITFRWEKKTDKAVTLKILDNVGRSVIEATPDSDSFVLNINEKNLNPGLYYWKLETEDDLLHLGRFFIK